MSMYIRVKRKKTTVFVHCEPTETLQDIKQKLQQLISQPADKMRLHKDGTVLEDGQSLTDAKVENDEVLALTYQQDDGSWEAIDITGLDAEAS